MNQASTSPTKRPQRRPAAPPSGFSLPELIVVIGIIAILISLLLPALSRVREQANMVKCAVTLRSIGMAAQLHVNEHLGYLPTAGWQWNPTGGTVNAEGLDDPSARKYDYYADDGERRPLPVTAALGQALGINLRTDSRENLAQDLQSPGLIALFRCPAATVNYTGWTQHDSDGWQSPDESSDYAFNEAILGRRDQPSGFPMGLATSIARASEVFLACDGRTRDPISDRCFLVFDFGPDDTLEDFATKIQTSPQGKELIDFWRHRRHINVLFVDGHVETFSTDAADLSHVGVSKGIR